MRRTVVYQDATYAFAVMLTPRASTCPVAAPSATRMPISREQRVTSCASKP
jgi:hypothetical protein